MDNDNKVNSNVIYALHCFAAYCMTLKKTLKRKNEDKSCKNIEDTWQAYMNKQIKIAECWYIHSLIYIHTICWFKCLRVFESIVVQSNCCRYKGLQRILPFDLLLLKKFWWRGWVESFRICSVFLRMRSLYSWGTDTWSCILPKAKIRSNAKTRCKRAL